MSTLNASNYTIGVAELWFAEDVVSSNNETKLTDPTSFGNIVTAEIAGDVTYVEHYISHHGSRRKDKELAVTKSISIPFTFDELNATNVRYFLLGKTVDADKCSIVMDKDKLEGRAILNFQTDVGNNFIYVIPSCTIKSDGGIGFNTDDWMQGNFILEVLHNSVYKQAGSAAASLAPYGYLDQSGRIILKSIIENWVNCWNILVNKLRQSAAKLTKKAMSTVSEKVQRLTDEDALLISLTRVPSIS